MTAISAAILELEAFRERLARQIASLRVLERTIEHSEQFPGDVFAPVVHIAPDLLLDAHPDLRIPVPTFCSPGAARPQPPPAPPVRKGVTTPATDSIATQILCYLNRQLAESTRADIATAVKMPMAVIAWPLKQLVRSGRVSAEGNTTTRRYKFVKAAVAPPAPSTSAPQFETVWNGTKERNGEAPGLSRHLSRKAS